MEATVWNTSQGCASDLVRGGNLGEYCGTEENEGYLTRPYPPHTHPFRTIIHHQIEVIEHSAHNILATKKMELHITQTEPCSLQTSNITYSLQTK
jgi:hypothetical protein